MHLVESFLELKLRFDTILKFVVYGERDFLSL